MVKKPNFKVNLVANPPKFKADSKNSHTFQNHLKHAFSGSFNILISFEYYVHCSKTIDRKPTLMQNTMNGFYFKTFHTKNKLLSKYTTFQI